MKIITRAEWGFDGWLRDSSGNPKVPYAVDEKSQRTEWFVHYEGGNPVLSQVGVKVPRDIHAFHKRQGWKGIGYGHVVDANGAIYEGRGFDMVGSHCPDHNTSGYSVQFHLGGNEKPTAAQIDSGRWLYAEACRRSGRRLAIKGHRDGFATACPGTNLYALVKSGVFAQSSTVPQEDDMPSILDFWTAKLTKKGTTLGKGEKGQAEENEAPLDILTRMARNIETVAVDARTARALSEEQAKTGRALTDEEIQRIAEATAREVGEGFTVEGAIVPKAQP